ncbi:hypothetical protein OpiT1DRAFT_02422 [Opitutaceae bacterium TAV1]|nr:hypothetical protein OpiT1DRAFT_02422 [Opitutaceae bacterium TAV1]
MIPVRSLVLSALASLAAAALVIPPLPAGPVSVTGSAANGWEIAGDALRVTITAGGDMRSIERLDARGQAAWRLNLPTSSFWSLGRSGKTWSLADAGSVSIASFRDDRGVGVKAVYDLKPAGVRVHLTWRIDTAEGDRLRVRYSLDHDAGEPVGLRFNIAALSNLDATADAWYVLPYRSGKLYRTDAVKYEEHPAPGHLWMQWTGYHDGKGNGLVSYPEDTTGFLKFAQHGPAGGFRMGWSESVVLTPGQSPYAPPYDYVIRPLATPDPINDLAVAYAEFGRAQSWAKQKLSDKLKARPQFADTIREGIVKFVGFGALDILEDGKRVFAPRERKERMAAPYHTFERALREARGLEALYDIRPSYRYDGWWGRFDAHYPSVFPVSDRLGGDAKFTWFQEENRKDNRHILYHLNPVQYDAEENGFDIDHMVALASGQPLRPDIWGGNRLYLASPKFATADNVCTLSRLHAFTGPAAGVFWDVIGAMAPYNDFNPRAGYPAWGGDHFYQDVLKLFAALRETAPDMIYGTEDGQEQMLPYFDWAPNYRSYGNDKTVSWAPLVELVYGDCFANIVGIDGNNRTYNDATRAVRALYGASMGHDARSAWIRDYTPVVQQIFELNRVFAPAATERMQRHLIDPAGWRASIWAGQVVVANTASPDVLAAVRVSSPLGDVVIEGLRPNGFAVVTRDGSWTAWGARKISVDGKTLVSTSNPDSILVRNDRGLTMTSYDFRNRDRGTEPSPQGCNLDAWQIEGDGLPAGWLEKLKTWPGKQPVNVTTTASATAATSLPAPGEAQVYRTF